MFQGPATRLPRPPQLPWQSMLRCLMPREALLGLRGASGLLLRCAGDGRTGYKMTIKTDGDMDGISYQLSFQPKGEWTEQRLPPPDREFNSRVEYAGLSD